MVIYQTNFGAEIFRISMHGDATPPPPKLRYIETTQLKKKININRYQKRIKKINL